MSVHPTPKRERCVPVGRLERVRKKVSACVVADGALEAGHEPRRGGSATPRTAPAAAPPDRERSAQTQVELDPRR